MSLFTSVETSKFINYAISPKLTTDISELTYVLTKETLTPLEARLGRNNLSDEPARSSELSPYVHANKAREAISVIVHATAQLFISTDQNAIPIENNNIRVQLDYTGNNCEKCAVIEPDCYNVGINEAMNKIEETMVENNN